jgi:hypothetical protein
MPEVKAVKAGLRALGDAGPKVGKSRLDQINAARKSAGLKPITEEQAAELLVTAEK